MNDDSSKKKDRGLIYILAALLFLGVVGIYYSSGDRFQFDGPMAELKDKASATIAATEKQGENLMAKASEVEDDVRDTLNQGRDKAEALGTDVVDKANRWVDSTKESGNQWAGKKTSVTGTGEQALGLGGSPEQGRAMASGAMETTQAEITGRLDSAEDEATGGLGGAKEGLSGQSEDVNKAVSGHSWKQIAASTQDDTQKSDFRDKKADTPSSASRCVGVPPKGKDLGSQYIVAYCETLGIISERTGVKVNDILDRNPKVKNPDLIYPNQKLTLPPRG